MAVSKRRLGRSPAKRQVRMELLAEIQSLYLSHHRALSRSPKTIAHYEDSFRLLDLYLSEAEMDPTTAVLTTQTFQGLIAYLKRTPIKTFRGSNERSVHGIHGVMKDMRAFCRWAQEEGYIMQLPKVPVPKLPEQLFPVLSEDELALIFGSKQLDSRSEIGKRNRALIAFLLDTGVRLNEVATLQLHDVNVGDGMAKVLGKGNKERMVFFSPGVTEAIHQWLAVRGDDDGSLFWLQPMGVRMLLERIKVETGLPRLHAHVLRHTAITMMVRNNVDLHTVRRIAGHTQLSTTEKYISMSTGDLKEKQNQGSPFEAIRSIVEPIKVRGRRRLKAS